LTGEVELIREAFEAWQAQSLESVSFLDPEIAWYPAEDEPDPRVRHGIEEVGKLWAEWLTSFEDFRLEPLEFIAAGENVIVPLRITGRIPGSEGIVAPDETQVFTVRDGRIVVVREYRTRAQAFAALGLDAGSAEAAG
jgi:ketosteroid isomerase-like protein